MPDLADIAMTANLIALDTIEHAVADLPDDARYRAPLIAAIGAAKDDVEHGDVMAARDVYAHAPTILEETGCPVADIRERIRAAIGLTRRAAGSRPEQASIR